MIIIDPATVGTAAVTSLITSFMSKTDSGPIKTLDDIWYFAFGRLSLAIDKKRAKHAAHLESFKAEIVQEVSAIPDDNLVEPSLSVVGPALDTSKYFIEEEILRSMFAKIVASSMDNRKNSRSHHAFVEIIKQLSPLDAKNLQCFVNHPVMPIAKFGTSFGMKGYTAVHNHVFINNTECDDFNAIASSLVNLQRLGLISIDYSTSLFGEELYAPFKNNKLYLELTEMLNSLEFDQMAQFFEDFLPSGKVMPKIEKGKVSITPFGEDFIFTCL